MENLLFTFLFINDILFSVNIYFVVEVKDATEQLLQKTSDKKKLLLILCKAFAQSADLVDIFLGYEVNKTFPSW